MAKNKSENTGNFQGATVIQGSTIYNAGQIAGTIVKADDASRKELQALIGQLGEALKTIPPEKKDDADALGASAEDLMKRPPRRRPTNRVCARWEKACSAWPRRLARLRQR